MQACHGSLERSADWLFSHADDLDSAVASVNGAGAPQAAASPAAGIAMLERLQAPAPSSACMLPVLHVPVQVKQTCIRMLAC